MSGSAEYWESMYYEVAERDKSGYSPGEEKPLDRDNEGARIVPGAQRYG